MQQSEMAVGVGGGVMALVVNHPLSSFQLRGVGAHRGAMQQKPLLMNPQGPARVRPEKQRVLNQAYRTPRV